jgi:hypothetical protein
MVQNKEHSYFRLILKRTLLVCFFFACLFFSTWFWWNDGNTFLNGNNGDHYYYVAQARMLNGIQYRDALQETALQFNYARPSVDLDYEWIDPSIAPLVYSRMSLPVVMAPLMYIFNDFPDFSVFLPGILLGTAGAVAVYFFARQRVGEKWAVTITGTALISPLLTEYRFGIYTEAPLIFGITLWLIAIYSSYENKAQIRQGLYAIAPIPFIALSRQAVLILVVYCIGFIIWTMIVNKANLKNTLRRFSPSIIVSIALYLLIAKWAPYDPLPYAKYNSDGQNLSMLETIQALIINLVEISITDVKRLLPGGDSTDLIYLLFLGISVFLSFKYIRRPEIGGVIFCVGFVLLVTALNGRPTSMRYISTIFPFFVVVPIYLIGESHKVISRRRASLPKLTNTVSAVASSCVVVATVYYCQPSPISEWTKISSSDFQNWPLIPNSGEISCSGSDFQVWFRDSKGTVYAASGPAMQRTLFTKRISEIYKSDPEILSSPAIEITKRGMELCGGSFMQK